MASITIRNRNLDANTKAHPRVRAAHRQRSMEEEARTCARATAARQGCAQVIVLDTYVVLELMKLAPADAVVRWIAGQPAVSLHTTSVTQAEILHGIVLLPAGKRRAALEVAAEAMFAQDFDGRVLPFGSEAACAASRYARNGLTTVSVPKHWPWLRSSVYSVRASARSAASTTMASQIDSWCATEVSAAASTRPRSLSMTGHVA